MNEELENNATELNIGNYYGQLTISFLGDKYYWMLEDQGDREWKEIPKFLYDSLLRVSNQTLILRIDSVPITF